MLVFAHFLPTLKQAVLRAGGIDIAIDTAIAKPQLDSMQQLNDTLDDGGSGDTDEAWRRLAERMGEESAVRRLAIEYLGHLAAWGHTPNQKLAASDKAFDQCGHALASAVRTEPALVELLPDTIGPPESIPMIMIEPILADTDATRAFLRGPVIAVKYLPRRAFNEINVRLVHEGVGVLKREFAFQSAAVMYGRRDGTSVAITANSRRPRLPLALDPDFGTELALEQPLADPEWDGTLRIEARVGHGSARRLGSPPVRSRAQQGKAVVPVLDGVFEHAWEVRFELIDPKSVRIFAAFEPYAAERVSESLRA